MTKDDARWRAFALVFLGAVLILRLATFLDYGVTWDEQLERRNALLTIRWYASGFTQATSPEGSDQHLYGSFFNVMVWLADQVSPLGYYETAHLLITLLGFLATAMSYRIAEDIAGPRAGLFSALSLSLTPVFFGHSFNNPKDVPFAALLTTALALSLRAYDSLPRLGLRRIVALGASIGLAAGIRVVGLSLVALLPGLVLFWHHSSRRREEKEPARAMLALASSVAGVALVAVVVALLWWPYLQVSPLRNALDLVRHVTHFEWDRTVLFEGRQMPARDLPRSYLPVWFLVSLPEFYFPALLAGGWLAARRLLAVQEPWSCRATVKVLLVLATVGVPVGSAIVLRPVLYDGLRQFLFVLPPLASLAGLGMDAIARQGSRIVRWLGLGLMGSSMALTALEMARLHPYQSIYFNWTIGGGLERASQRFETDYWGTSYKEAVDWLIAEYRPGGARRVRVANVSNHFLTAYYLSRGEAPARFEAVPQPRRADVVLATTRWNEHRSWPGRILHTVTREGVALCYVIERSRP